MADLDAGDSAASECGAAPGSCRITGMPAPRYHAHLQRHSCSTLKQMLVSPAYYLRQIGAPHRASAAMEFGTLLHLLILEPHLLPHEYAIVPGTARPSAAERCEAQALNPGLKVLTEVQLHEARLVADKVLARPVRGRPLYKYVEEGLREVSYFFSEPVTGLPCRCRFDLWHPDAIFDLKTTRHAGALGFSRACIELHYDMQAYMYCYADAIYEGRGTARDFVFVAVQNEPPNPVHVMSAGSTFMANGQAKFVRAASLARACADCDWWPDGSSDGVLEIEPWQVFDPRGSAIDPSCFPRAQSREEQKEAAGA